ncbi:sodium/solute symporter [Marinilongibacter aquaticus]|uniref:sodium:solute symporter family transporter n=1 Tax=Marinilongibacter aquaticus TaxID=2975157 RepID=UPI0021BD07BF|nr:sodium/solute symporter [Marinilongibacter aquaticus]UBM58676.1 sodium/solute symporter [Marinilongibacter aquaticus]
MKHFFSILLFSVLTQVFGQDHYLNFSHLPALPPNTGYAEQPGLAGAYIGTDDGVLIVAGGANFPDKRPWDGGAKVYYNEVFLLKKGKAQDYVWERTETKIPLAAAYGGAVPTAKGLLCFGGATKDPVVSESWFIDYNPSSDKLEIRPGPPLPVALSNFAFSKLDGQVFVAGGTSDVGGFSKKIFLSLDVSSPDMANWKWKNLPTWEGAPRSFAVGASQSDGADNCFYLFSGRNVKENGEVDLLYDAHVYLPKRQEWSRISDGQDKAFPVMAGTAFPLGANTIAFASGANGELMQKQRELEQKIVRLQSQFDQGHGNERALYQAKQKLLEHLRKHPGFGHEVLGFNTITKKVFTLAALQSTGQVTTTAVQWGDRFVVPTGEIRPGVRTPEVLEISLKKDVKRFSELDIVVIVIYFLILSWMGYVFSKRQNDTDDYFKGGGRIPWWAAGLSIFGTALSAITFMAVPAKTFATDWSYFVFNMTIFLVAPLIVLLFIPFFRKLNVATAYAFLENRFSLGIRLIGSVSFIVYQIGRMGVVLFLPSIALNVVTGIDIFVCIALMGSVSMLYTLLGGIEAVIWTDVMQVLVLLGGAVLSLVLIGAKVDGGFAAIVETASVNHKFNLVDFTFSLKQPTVWVMLIGGVFANMCTYGTDQTMVQRYLTTKTENEANRSVWTNAFLVIPSTILFFFIGTALFAFYRSFPQELNPTLQNNDAIFPWFIVSELPQGVSGVLIAAIFAAAMSSLSSSMNSAATAYSTDIHFRFGWTKNRKPLKVARMATFIFGLSGTLSAFIMASMDIQSLWDVFQQVLGLLIGSLGGVFLLGMLTVRANTKGVLVGIGISILVQVLVAFYQPVHLLLYSATGVISCFITGFVASLFFQGKS